MALPKALYLLYKNAPPCFICVYCTKNLLEMQGQLPFDHDNCMSKQFVNDVVSIAILATCWHDVPMPPLEGEVPNEREAEGFVRKLSKKTPLRLAKCRLRRLLACIAPAGVSVSPFGLPAPALH